MLPAPENCWSASQTDAKPPDKDTPAIRAFADFLTASSFGTLVASYQRSIHQRPGPSVQRKEMLSTSIVRPVGIA